MLPASHSREYLNITVFTQLIWGIALLTVLALAPTAAKGQKRKHKFPQPFTYDAKGIGGTPVEGVILLAQGTEVQVASRVLVQTLQELQHGFVRRQEDLQNPLTPNKEYSTDIVPLGNELDQYNSNPDHSKMPLAKDVLYGISYKVRYQINDEARNRNFLIELTPILHKKGAGGKWREYSKSYSSKFFADRVLTLLERNFKNSSIPKQN
jgi:hypothetical protein